MNLKIQNLAFSYDHKRPLFHNISFEINSGEIVSILGPNGAGKTTLLNCVAGLFKPCSGAITIDGKDVQKMSAREVARSIGYVPQIIIPSFSFSVMEYVVTGCAPVIGTFERPKEKHYQIAADALEQMGIAHLSDRSYMNISGGERQQVSIARALAQRPGFILMDEPTAHLDYGNQIKVLKTIRKMASQGYGIILTTHNPDHVLLLEGKLAVLNQSGDLFFGTQEEIMNEEFLYHLYGTDLKLVHIEILNRLACLAPKL